MNLKDVTEYIVAMWKDCEGDMENSTPLMLLGPPGVGKTSACRAAAQAMEARMRAKDPNARPALCRVLDTSSMLPEDLGGVPYRDNGVTRYAPQSWMAELCEEGAYGVLCLDDIAASAPAVQVAARQLMLERRIHDARLAPGIVLMATGNRREDKSAATTLPAHFRNSVQLLEVEPNIEDWFMWYGAQEKHDPVVSAFLRFKGSLFSKLPSDADKRGAFATPRTWAKLGRLCGAAERSGQLLEVAQGLVGEGPAVEFLAFRKVRAGLVPPESVLLDPKKAIPDPVAQFGSGQNARMDQLYATITGIAEVAAFWNKNKGTHPHGPKAAEKLLFALMHVLQNNKEMLSVSLSTFAASGGDPLDFTQAAKMNVTNPAVKEMLKFVHGALNLG